MEEWVCKYTVQFLHYLVEYLRLWAIGNSFKANELVQKGNNRLIKYLKLNGHIKLSYVTIHLAMETENKKHWKSSS